jgi:hypothetical protein
MGPRTPITSPSLMLCSFVVTEPALLTVKSRVSPSVGLEAIPMGASPYPGTLSSANWPGT